VQRYIVERLVHGLLVLVGVSIVTFCLVRLTGDPAVALAGPDATAADVARLHAEMGLDEPLWIQYLRYADLLVHGDFGRSQLFRQPALPLVLERLPATLELAAAALVVTLAISLPLGVLSAVRRGGWIDRVGTVFVFAAQSMPVFWSSIMLILVVALWWGLLPASGRGGPQYVVLPALALGFHSAAQQTRLLRSAMLDTLSNDYLRTARAKGLTERVVIVRHAFRNALVPLVTATGLQFALLMGGAVITETVFAWPGMGSLAVQAISNRDLPLVMAATALFAIVILFVNLLVDLSYAAIDPRVRLG
jgi:peptide/nickel transport system permease protein